MIASVLQHVVDLMNDHHQLVAATHTLIHAEQPAKSNELLTSHHTDNFQVFIAFIVLCLFPSMLWWSWLGDWKGIQPAKILLSCLQKFSCGTLGD